MVKHVWLKEANAAISATSSSQTCSGSSSGESDSTMSIGTVKPDVIAKPAASTQPAALVEPSVEGFAVDRLMPFVKHAEKPDQSAGMVKHADVNALLDALQREVDAERDSTQRELKHNDCVQAQAAINLYNEKFGAACMRSQGACSPRH